MLPTPWLARAATRLADLLAALRRRMIPRHYAALDIGTMSWVAHSLSAFCELGVADALAGGPQTPAQLSASGFGDEQLLARLLRSLCAYDVVRFRPGGRFELGRTGKALTGADSIAPMIRYANARWHTAAYSHLAQAVRAGQPAFNLVNGESLFAFLRRDPDAAQVFDAAMQSVSPLYAQPFAHSYDFSRFESVVDVGGGTGALLAAIGARYPLVRLTVFEIPSVCARGSSNERIRFVEGDMFANPPPAADAYILSHVLHDWDDVSCRAILRNVRSAMEPRCRLLINELVAPPPNNRWSPDRVSDLEMMAVLTGKERTREEFEALLSSCGLRLNRLIATQAPEAVIECVPDGIPAPSAGL